MHSGDCSELRCGVLSLSLRPGASSGLLPPLRSLGGNQEKRGKSDTLTGLGVCQSVMCARGESTQQSAHTPRLPPKTPRWIMKYSHRRCSSDCQHGHLTNFSETHPKAQRAGPPSEPQTGVIVVPLFAFFLIYSKERNAHPWISSAVKCAHVGDARCVQTAPTDRQTHPAAFPASPLLHPFTSVTLTVKAHLSICCSNCSLGWLSFQRCPVSRTYAGDARHVREHTYDL